MAQTMSKSLLAAAALLTIAAQAPGQSADARGEAIRFPGHPALSPDGATLAFDWRGDVWSVPIEGGAARQLTQHEGSDSLPKFSPDGRRIALVSDRSGSAQIHLIDAAGGVPEQLTAHTAGYRLEGWFPGGESLLASCSRDHHWRRAERFFEVSLQGDRADRLLFDAYGREGALSPDGARLLFTREGVAWWRKGYRGAGASQVWMIDLESGEFEKLLDHDGGSRSPVWKPDGSGFYYVGAESGSFNLWEYALESGEKRRITAFKDDSVVSPTVSADGSTLVFRHLFDLYALRVGSGDSPQRIEIWNAGDRITDPLLRRTLSSAQAAAFSADGLEVVFAAGGDLWVMDTVLREPQRLTDTPEEERGPVFSPEGDAILFVSDQGGQADIWRARRADEDLFWWQNEEFPLERLSQDPEVESGLRWSPEGSKVAFVRGNGELWTMDPDGKGGKRLLSGWDSPDYTWAPDGAWIAYAVEDDDFNRDLWIMPSDGSGEPVNISKHPDSDGNPAWSPDGKAIAFTGRRTDDETDLYYVFLTEEDDQETSRDRKVEEALEKMKKARKKKDKEKPKKPEEPAQDEPEEPQADEPAEPQADEPTEAKEEEKKEPEKKKEDEKGEEELTVEIDFQDINERIRRISIPDSAERQPFWSHDSKKLAFTASIDGKRGVYTVEPPEEMQPKLLSSSIGSDPVWIEEGNQILWLSGGSPASLSASGKETRYGFSARQELVRADRNRVAFDMAWRAMRDGYYDERLGNRNWDAIRRKYVDMAAAAVDSGMLASVVSMMLGELNGSHLGFYAGGGGFSRRGPSSSDGPWRVETAHLGLRFDPDHQGPGLKVRDVLLEGPADKHRARIEPGEVVLAIDGQSVDPSLNLTPLLNGTLDREIDLRVRGAEGEDRDVSLRPISQRAARSLLYRMWTRENRRVVDEVSGGALGYLHIRGMNWSSFLQFEEELYSVGAGRDGILIDVRENGGGSTADHLLTVLTQPSHAITVPRGGGPGYPQDRRVYATWSKPIAVLCNQNSFSNAEIFSHAIKHLGRGQLIGVPTAGGVISTGGVGIMDVGFLRMPFRGWFLLGDGEDMELNGAVPHHIVWPHPADERDAQLDKSIEVLMEDVRTWRERPQPALKKASER